MFTIIRADQTRAEIRPQMADIFADGFTQWLGFFSKDKRQISRAFAHIFVESQFYLAMSGDKVAAMAACTDGTELSVRLNTKQLIKHLGFYKGMLAVLFLKREFQVPFHNPNGDQISLEFVGTALEFRGQGAASQVITHILGSKAYKECLIEEVADTNIPAIRLYEKLGFKEYKRKALPKKLAEQNGIHHLVSMKYVNIDDRINSPNTV
ncbi:N-acetyltransferase [Paenibacillus sp. 1011MAR3C5]|uniref:GNAT family N-acetyltransferase n=1 Tax=Paenibacillus sp. 1011MAR3C5 TaxID=1675787 RepID=UPI000E6C1422|nr:GNAT family N-acetyltransferase [Paenibacillus sp. 1011MAR3C5]RJE84757.1 N-acetyltransferase [Paenibacillus sp. 1011MAR3C5]